MAIVCVIVSIRSNGISLIAVKAGLRRKTAKY